MPFLAVPGVMTAIGVGASITGAVVGAGVGIYGAIAAQQAAQYNAQIQQQNAAIQYQMAVQQQQYAMVQAQFNFQLAVSNQAIQQRNQQFAMHQAGFAQQKYQLQLNQAKQLEQESQAVRARQREEARRIREEGARRQGIIVAKYGGSGVLVTEGSPLVVLADEARLTSAQVQDATYVAELESRKKLYGAEIQRFEAQFTLLEKAGYEGKAFDARMAEFGTVLEQANQRNNMAMATYNSLISGVQYEMNLRKADMIRYEGDVAMITGIAGGVASGISGVGGIVTDYAKTLQLEQLYKGTSGVQGGVSSAGYLS